MRDFMKRHGASVTTAAVALLAVGSASAAPLTLPTELTDAVTSVGVIGAGVFAIAVGIKIYKWARSALS